MRSLWILAAVAVGSFLAPVTPAATLTVDLNGGADYTDIQAAIDAAANGDTVLVKPGEYAITEPINFNRLHNPDDPASPPVKNIIVKSEGGAEVTTIRMAETPTNLDRASVVIFENGETNASVLDRLTLTGGKGTLTGEPGSAHFGGGVLCLGSSPNLTNCTISGNSATGNMLWGPGAGGAAYCAEGSSPTLTNCTISGNPAHLSVGTVVFMDSSPTMTNCTITGNGGYRGQGTVSCGNEAVPMLSNCTIARNEGGGVFCSGTTTLTNCTISGNSGAGFSCWGNHSPTLTNCTISGNGGGVSCSDGSYPRLTNCTISGNGSGVYCYDICDANCRGASPEIVNCVVWGNTFESISVSPNSSPQVSFSLVEGDEVWPGQGNVNGDPIFAQPGQWEECDSASAEGCVSYQWNPDTGTPTAWHRWLPGDYHLQPGSPAIDAGTSEGAPATDIEGNVRQCGAGVDIGAYESGDCWPSTRFQRGDSNADGSFDISDPAATLGFLFLGTEPLPCFDSADVDDDSGVNITDAIYSLNFLFLGGPAPAAPFEACGIDRTLDELDCAAFAPCGTGG